MNFEDIQKEQEVISKSFMVRVAEQAKNYEDMFQFVKDLISAKKQVDFTVEERNLLSTAFKNSIEADRKSMRIITAVS